MDKLASTLKEATENLYREMWKSTESLDGECGLIIPQWGEKFPDTEYGGILFVGKAPNLRTSGHKDKANGLKMLESFGKENLSWLKNDDTNHSAYLRIVKKISKKLFKNNYYANIAISNLYKLGPLDKDYPSARLLNLQKNNALKIFLKELEILKPRFVVMFSSELEKSGFLKRFQNDGKSTGRIDDEVWGSQRKYTTKVYKIHETFFIASRHPQGKNEENHIDVIISFIKKYNTLTL